MTHATLVPLCEDNLEALADIGQELMALSSYPQPFDRTWSINIARRAMLMPNYFCRLAAHEDGGFCGLIIGSISPMIFSPLLMAVEETVYVREGVRFRTSIARQMLGALTFWAFDEQHAAFIRAGETSGIDPKGVDAFFKLCGFKKAGTLYGKEPK